MYSACRLYSKNGGYYCKRILVCNDHLLLFFFPCNPAEFYLSYVPHYVEKRVILGINAQISVIDLFFILNMGIVYHFLIIIFKGMINHRLINLRTQVQIQYHYRQRNDFLL